MAEKDWQPGSPGQALGLKFNLNFFFSLNKLSREEGGWRGGLRERIPCCNRLLSFLFTVAPIFHVLYSIQTIRTQCNLPD